MSRIWGIIIESSFALKLLSKCEICNSDSECAEDVVIYACDDLTISWPATTIIARLRSQLNMANTHTHTQTELRATEITTTKYKHVIVSLWKVHRDFVENCTKFQSRKKNRRRNNILTCVERIYLYLWWLMVHIYMSVGETTNDNEFYSIGKLIAM